MLSSSTNSPPWSLHRSIQIFHCWKQCCRSSSDSLFMSSIAFAFTASTDSNLVPFSADFIFGNKKKSHGARSGEYGGCSNTVILCFVKNVLTVRALCAGALSWWRTHELFFHISCLLLLTRFTKVCQNLLVVNLVNSLTFRHPIHVNNPSDVGKNDHHCFKSGFALLCFPLPSWTRALPVHGLALTFWVILKKPRFITSYYVLYKVWAIFNVLKNVSTNVHLNCLLFRSEESQHHLWTHFFHVEMVM